MQLQIAELSRMARDVGMEAAHTEFLTLPRVFPASLAFTPRDV